MTTLDPYSKAAEAAAYLKTKGEAPVVAAVLGSGLGAFADKLENAERIPFADIPHFPNVAGTGHAGGVVLGNLPGNGPRIVVLAGRVHIYEGHELNVVVHALRSLALWGVKAVLLTNAAGGLGDGFQAGDLMLITDHLNLTGKNPLVGKNDDRLGARFPDMSTTYDPALCDIARNAAKELGITLREGVYAGMLGPSYETPAEIRMLKILGASAVGMSTVCEAIAARHAGMKVLGFSCITNLAAGISKTELNHAEVKETADKAAANFTKLVELSLSRVAKALS